MKVIVTYRKFRDITLLEIPPEVYIPEANETAEEALRRIWEDEYNALIAEYMFDDSDDGIDENLSWIEDDMALITWNDGDQKEFYIVDAQRAAYDE